MRLLLLMLPVALWQTVIGMVDPSGSDFILSVNEMKLCAETRTRSNFALPLSFT